MQTLTSKNALNSSPC